MPNLELSVSATTRRPRPGEVEGRDYWFLTPDEFQKRLDAGEFLEHAEYAGHRYGTLRSELDRAAAKGDDAALVMEIELQGARQVREKLPEAIQVFIEPPSRDALRARLVGRGAEKPEEVEQRMAVAEKELEAAPEFDRRIVNDRLEEAVQELEGLVATMLGRTQGANET
jgi:guanylate kinase